MNKFIKVLKNRRIINYRGLWYADITELYKLIAKINKHELKIIKKKTIVIKKMRFHVIRALIC
jgi:hypothetical protein